MTIWRRPLRAVSVAAMANACWAICGASPSTGVQPPDIRIDALFELVLAMLGMAGLRSFEKTTGRTK